MTTITQTFDPPLPSDSAATFDGKAFAVVAGLNAWSTQANALAADVNAQRGAAQSAQSAADISAIAAASRAQEAGQYVIESLSAAEASVQASGAQRWVSGVTYAQDAVVISPLDLLSYRRRSAGAGTTDPSQDPANYARLTSVRLLRSARTANAALGVGDLGAIVEITGGTFTQTFEPAVTLGGGWWCYISNTGTGDITLNPSVAELIDGLVSYVMYPGEVRLVQCDGVTLRTVVINSFYKVFETSGAWVKPPGYTTIEARIWAGGASGAAAVGSSSMASGSGGAACVPLTETPSRLPTSVVVTVGAGGSSVSTQSVTNGVFGGTSQFIVAAYSGGPGWFVTSTSTPLAGGGGGGILTSGATGATSLSSGGTGGEPRPETNGRPSNQGFGGANSSLGFSGGDAVYGGGAGGGIRSAGAGDGGRSVYGGGGSGGVSSTFVGGSGTSNFAGWAGASSNTGTASPGQAPGGAGGSAWAASGTATSGAGGRGEVRIWGVI